MTILSNLTGNNLTRVIKARNCKVEDIKLEALLAVVHKLLDQFITQEEKRDEIFIAQKENENIKDREIIDNVAKEIYDYLDNREDFYSISKISKILLQATNTNKLIDYSLSLCVEPISYFYDVMVEQYKKDFNKLLKNEAGQNYWLPELLAFNLIYDLKQKINSYDTTVPTKFKNFSFQNFELLDKYSFAEVNKIYAKYSITINKNRNKNFIILNPEDMNIVQKTKLISKNILNSLVDSKYKAVYKRASTHKKRKSKQRKKKK